MSQSIGGRGKVVGQSSSSVMNAYVGQSNYSGGRGNCDEQNNNADSNAYVGQSIGGRGKVVGQSSSSVMNAYVGQSNYSGGRGNCYEQNNINAATNAYVGQSIGGRGKVVGQSSSSVMNVGQSSYSGGRGKSIGHSTHYVKKVYVPEAHRPQSPSLTPESPASNNASTPTVDSPTAHEVEVNSGTSRATSSTDHESLVEGNETRGAYLSKNIPTKETDKKIIHIVGRNYLEQFAVRAITVDFKAHFKGKESQWHRLDKRLVDLYYKSFQDRFRYEADVTPELAREVWEERASIRCRGTWACVRRQCKKVTGSTNPADWSAHRPVFVHQRDWEGILDSWMTEEWIRLSVSGTANRKKVPGENEGGCMYVRHTGGSVNFGIHCQRLETILGKRPNQIQLFERVHKKAKGKGEWCDTRAEKVARKYHEKIKDKQVQEGDDGEQPLPSDIPFDGKVWIEVIGIPKKKQVYGFGLTEEAENILHESGYSTSSKKFKTCSSSSNNLTQAEIELRIQEEVDARLAVRVEEVRMEMNQKMQEQMLKMFQEHLKSLK